KQHREPARKKRSEYRGLDPVAFRAGVVNNGVAGLAPNAARQTPTQMVIGPWNYPRGVVTALPVAAALVSMVAAIPGGSPRGAFRALRTRRIPAVCRLSGKFH